MKTGASLGASAYIAKELVTLVDGSQLSHTLPALHAQ